jgi:metallo-beta-lactamase family protein
MKITFLGAAKTVTGSCYLIETKRSKFLVDCGMFQGRSADEALNHEPFPFNPAGLDFMILTHAHIDHSGRIPKLYNDGFKGKIHTTKATAELCAIMLPDSGHIQEFENEWINRKRERAGQPPIKPLYTFQEATDCIKLFVNEKYDTIIKLSEDVSARFKDAGHILGSAIIEMWINEDGVETKLVFSGDLGNKHIPIMRDPTIIDSADYLFIESTYGDRLHTEINDKVDRFVDIINATAARGGTIVIPSFAVGRTQEIIYELHNEREKYGDKLSKLLELPVYVDSPLAVSATKVFRNNLDCFDDEARAYIQNGDNPLDFPGLKFTQSSDESKALNDMTGSMIIISASGMCDAGRIKHHLKHNLWRKESSVIFVGYQAEGTLGRRLVDGAKRVKIFGEEITVNAQIEMIEGFSGHADKNGLLEWITAFDKKPGKIFIIHGEESVMNEFSAAITDKLRIETIIPDRGNTYIVSKSSVSGAETKMPAVQAKLEYSSKRIEILEMLDKLRSELDEASEIVRNDLRNRKDDVETEALKSKLLKFEKDIVDIIK